MKLPHDHFCMIPWISLETGPIGTVRPCCLANEEIVDDQGQKFDLSTANLGDVQKSQHMRNLRKQFLDGQRPSTCSKCWNEEAAGRTSKRMHTLDRLKHMAIDDKWTLDAKPLMFLDLKLGNICNLKCRICGSWSSSAWATEELQQLPQDQRRSGFHYDMHKKGNWPRDNDLFWQQIDQLSDHLRYIEFTGGEPFMIDQHFDLLQGLVDRGLAGQIEIHYNTNGTHYPQRGPDIWQHFRTVEVAFSVDDLGPRFEYQRTNAQWSAVNHNLHQFRNLRHQFPNIRLQCCSTVSVFNVMYLEDLANWIDDQAFDFVYWNVLHEAAHLSVRHMPVAAKDQAVQRLQQCQVRAWHQREFSRIADFMQSGPGSDGTQLLATIKQLDQRRATDLCDHHKELADAIGYEGS